MKYFLYPILSFLSLYATAQDATTIANQNSFSKWFYIDSPKMFFGWGTELNMLPTARRPDRVQRRGSIIAVAWDSEKG